MSEQTFDSATKFMKRPVAIEAVQFCGLTHNKGETCLPIEKFNLFPVTTKEQPKWMLDAILNGTIILREEKNDLHIKTLEGWVSCTPGNWVLKGVRDELYPCEDSIFRETYYGVE